MELTEIEAQSAICSWKQGVFPSKRIDDLTVGREAEADATRNALASAAAAGSGGLFFEAEYGHGKSHMLHFVESLAHDAGFAVSWIAFDHKSHAFNHPTRYLHNLFENLRFPHRAYRGLATEVLRALGDERRSAIVDFAAKAPWFVRSAIDRLARAGLLDEDREAACRLLECRDLQSKSGIIHYAEVYTRLRFLSELIRCLGYRGVVWLFDEVECLSKLPNCQSRFAGYSLLSHFMTPGAFPYSWFFFTTTGDFRDRMRAEKIPYARYEGAPAFVQSWREGKCETYTLRKLRSEDKLRLLHAMRAVHQKAFAWAAEERVTDDFLVTFLDRAIDAGLTERELLKSIVSIFEICEQHAECDPMTELFSAISSAQVQSVA